MYTLSCNKRGIGLGTRQHLDRMRLFQGQQNVLHNFIIDYEQIMLDSMH